MEGNGHSQTPRLKDGSSALTEWIMNSIADTKFSHATLADWPKQVDLHRIQAQFESPAWIVSEHQLTQNAHSFAKFTGECSRIYYPVKTNPSLTVLQVLAKLGVGADCASQLEINLALLAGIAIENISYNTPVQDVLLCERLLTSGANVVMDDIDALLELQSEMGTPVFKGKLLLRVNLLESIGYANKNDHQELMAHGHQSSKFGIPAEDLNAVLEQISLPVSGLHVHVGTQMDNLHSFEHAIVGLNALVDTLEARGHRVSEINLGGGLGIPFDSNQDFPSLEAWCQHMLPLKKENIQYSVEPGHALIGNAVALLTCVQTIKESRGKKWAIVDVGTDQLTKVTLLKWPHRILTASGEELQKGNDAVAGPLCFAGDTLNDQVNVGHLKKGAPLLITEAGAYTFSLSNKFNGRTAPKWLLLKSNGELIQSMEKESLYDELHHVRYDWEVIDGVGNPLRIALDKVKQLSSTYLYTTCEADRFEYLNATKVSDNHYQYTVRTTSVVGFISMPFAIRIVGDAAIVSILHRKGDQKKAVSVWGRRLTIDCYQQIPSNENFEFTIGLSETIQKGDQSLQIARFKSSCGRCTGSIVITY